MVKKDFDLVLLKYEKMSITKALNVPSWLELLNKH